MFLLLVRHVRKHTKEKPFKCPQCDKAFVSKHSRNQHLKQHSEYLRLQSQVICSFCDKTLSSSQALSVHTRLHHGSKPFSCNTCLKCFTTRGQLDAHREKGHGRVFTTLQKKCDANQSTATQSVDKNKRTEVVKLKDPLLVTTAGVFRTVSAKSNHEFTCWDKDHDKNRYPCKKCGKLFRSAAYCKRHEMSHEAPEARQFSCSLCHNKFKTNITLKNHILKHFRTDKKFKCSDCPKKFSAKTNLKWHKLVAHNETKPFLCPYCGKSFKLTSLCKGHIETHRKAIESGKEIDAEVASVIPEPESDAVAVGDAHFSLRIIPRPDAKDYGNEVTLVDAEQVIKQKAEQLRQMKKLTRNQLGAQSSEKVHHLGNPDSRIEFVWSGAESSSNNDIELNSQTTNSASTAEPASPTKTSATFQDQSLLKANDAAEKTTTSTLQKLTPNILRKRSSTSGESNRKNLGRLVSDSNNVPTTESSSSFNSVTSVQANSTDINVDFPNRTVSSEAGGSLLPGALLNPPQIGAAILPNTEIDVSSREEGPLIAKVNHGCAVCGKTYPTSLQLKAHKLLLHSRPGLDKTRDQPTTVDDKSDQLDKDKTWTLYGKKMRRPVDRQTKLLSKIQSKSAKMSNKQFEGAGARCTICHLWFSSAARLRKHCESYHIVKPQCLSGSLSATGPPPKYKDPDFIRISSRDAADIKSKMAQTCPEDQLNVTISEKILLKSIDELAKEIHFENWRAASTSNDYQKQLPLTQDKTHQCSDCPKAFSSQGHLATHSRTHTHERPFTCALCMKTYKTRSSFNYHVT